MRHRSHGTPTYDDRMRHHMWSAARERKHTRDQYRVERAANVETIIILRNIAILLRGMVLRFDLSLYSGPTFRPGIDPDQKLTN
jgi:hypothetical protein